MSQEAALTQGQDSAPPCTFPKREKAAPSTSPDTELSWMGVAGQVAQQPNQQHLFHSQPPLYSASIQELGHKTGPEKFLCHLLPCPSTQLHETHGKISQCPITISIDTNIHIQGPTERRQWPPVGKDPLMPQEGLGHQRAHADSYFFLSAARQHGCHNHKLHLTSNYQRLHTCLIGKVVYNPQ